MTIPETAPPEILPSPRIGIYKTRYTGDILLLVPLLNKVRDAFPGAFLFLIVNEGTEDPLRLMGIPHFSFRNGSFFQKSKSVLEMLQTIRNEKFDYWFDFTVSDRSRFLAGQVNSRRKIGGGWEYDHKKGDLFDLFVPFDYDRGPEHIVSFHERVFRMAGLSLPNTPPNFSFPQDKEDEKKAREYLEAMHFHEDPILVLHPGGRHWFKRWSPDRFGRIANWWDKTFGGVILVVGTKDEESLLDSVGAAIAPKIRWAKLQESLSFLYAILSRSSLFIGNDSGPMHLAHSAGIPTVALFGSTQPSVWGPLGSDRFRIVYKGVECSPCQHVGCTLADENCLRQIPVDDVIGVAASLMTRYGYSRT